MTNMTETDGDITRDDEDEIVITKGYEREREVIRERDGAGTNGVRTNGAGTNGAGTRSYRREVIGEKEREL